jgi:hypothetical protein
MEGTILGLLPAAAAGASAPTPHQQPKPVKVYEWTLRDGTAAELKKGSLVVTEAGEILRVKQCSHSKSGMKGTHMVHFIFQNGREDIVQHTEPMKLAIRKRIDKK